MVSAHSFRHLFAKPLISSMSNAVVTQLREHRVEFMLSCDFEVGAIFPLNCLHLMLYSKDY